MKIKDTLLGFLIATVLFICTAATIKEELLTIKPIIPKSTVVYKVYSNNVTESCKKWADKGYDIYSVSAPSYSGYVMVVVKKY